MSKASGGEEPFVQEHDQSSNEPISGADTSEDDGEPARASASNALRAAHSWVGQFLWDVYERKAGLVIGVKERPDGVRLIVRVAGEAEPRIVALEPVAGGQYLDPADVKSRFMRLRPEDVARLRERAATSRETTFRVALEMKTERDTTDAALTEAGAFVDALLHDALEDVAHELGQEVAHDLTTSPPAVRLDPGGSGQVVLRGVLTPTTAQPDTQEALGFIERIGHLLAEEGDAGRLHRLLADRGTRGVQPVDFTLSAVIQGTVLPDISAPIGG